MLFDRGQALVVCPKTHKEMIKQVKGLKDNNQVTRFGPQKHADKKSMEVSKMTKAEIALLVLEARRDQTSSPLSLIHITSLGDLMC